MVEALDVFFISNHTEIILLLLLKGLSNSILRFHYREKQLKAMAYMLIELPFVISFVISFVYLLVLSKIDISIGTNYYQLFSAQPKY